MDAIRVRDVTKEFGEVTALDGLSLSVESGTTFGLLGTNGAGKTTLFKMLVGHLRPDDGTVEVAGQDVEDAGPSLREDVGYLPEHAGFPPSLTGREVLQFHARVRGIPKADREDRITEVLDTVGLADAGDRAVSGYSNGMNRRLGLATALLPRPSVLLLDEPTAGLDPRGVSAFHRIVSDLRAETDLTVVVSSHVLGEVEKLCEDVAILHEGELRAAGPVADLRRDLGDVVTVSARLADESDRERAVETVRRFTDDVEADGAAITAHCSHATVSSLLAALEDEVDLDGFEVDEPGLDAVFERAVGDAPASEVDADDPREVSAR